MRETAEEEEKRSTFTLGTCVNPQDACGTATSDITATASSNQLNSKRSNLEIVKRYDKNIQTRTYAYANEEVLQKNISKELLQLELLANTFLIEFQCNSEWLENLMSDRGRLKIFLGKIVFNGARIIGDLDQSYSQF
ncbi:hypothetical protein WN51_12435 [Melipona quadrifasciata]|uniref:Uncharacterized protein n=1 Tax=Melipona quadrifasciata TaxID=166423 RepID=A0A0M9A2L5_9HYME|nr:hypothetical protein WN51_12435 [Melipona quadrifasciata]